MAVKSGRGGTAKLSASSLWTIPNLLRWSYSRSVGDVPYNDGGTAGETTRFTGNADSNGTIEWHVSGGSPDITVEEGTLANIILHTASGVFALSGTVFVTDFNMEVDTENKTPIVGTLSWKQSGALTRA